mgnify:CR=1 FL=1
MNKNIKKLIEYPKEGILSKEVLGNKFNVSLFCMAKNSRIGKHTSTKSGIVYVLEGKGIFSLDKEEIKMAPGTFIFMEKNAVHSLIAEENTSFLLILT